MAHLTVSVAPPFFRLLPVAVPQNMTWPPAGGGVIWPMLRTTGLKQGDALSPLLLNLDLKYAIRKV
jgi:hypothetical protein